MNMQTGKKRYSQVWALVAGPLIFAALAMAPSGAQDATSGSPTAGQRRAVGLLRQLNNAEFKYQSQFQRFGTLSELLNSRIPQEITDEMAKETRHRDGSEPHPDLSSSDPVPGYSFALYVSADGSHYIASVRNSSREQCSLSFYADERGAIVQGKDLGCK